VETAKHTTGAMPATPAQEAGGAALRVFLVDDLPSTQRLIGDLFAALGGIALAGVASSEGEAKLWLDDNPGSWDVAVIDLVLEAGSGMGVIPHARECNPAGAVVVFSGYATPVLSEHCAKLGADAVFHKEDAEAFVNWLRQVGAQP
jgi:DNA-binding NarL/FixJ family response regulator